MTTYYALVRLLTPRLEAAPGQGSAVSSLATFPAAASFLQVSSRVREWDSLPQINAHWQEMSNGFLAYDGRARSKSALVQGLEGSRKDRIDRYSDMARLGGTAGHLVREFPPGGLDHSPVVVPLLEHSPSSSSTASDVQLGAPLCRGCRLARLPVPPYAKPTFARLRLLHPCGWCLDKCQYSA